MVATCVFRLAALHACARRYTHSSCYTCCQEGRAFTKYPQILPRAAVAREDSGVRRMELRAPQATYLGCVSVVPMPGCVCSEQEAGVADSSARSDMIRRAMHRGSAAAVAELLLLLIACHLRLLVAAQFGAMTGPHCEGLLVTAVLFGACAKSG